MTTDLSGDGTCGTLFLDIQGKETNANTYAQFGEEPPNIQKFDGYIAMVSYSPASYGFDEFAGVCFGFYEDAAGYFCSGVSARDDGPYFGHGVGYWTWTQEELDWFAEVEETWEEMLGNGYTEDEIILFMEMSGLYGDEYDVYSDEYIEQWNEWFESRRPIDSTLGARWNPAEYCDVTYEYTGADGVYDESCYGVETFNTMWAQPGEMATMEDAPFRFEGGYEAWSEFDDGCWTDEVFVKGATTLAAGAGAVLLASMY